MNMLHLLKVYEWPDYNTSRVLLIRDTSFRSKISFLDLVSGQSLITRYIKYPEMKLIAGVISMRSI